MEQQAQLDRFAMKLSVGYPAANDEKRMLSDAVLGSRAPAADTTPALADGQLEAIQGDVAAVSVAEPVLDYLVRLAAATRSHRDVLIGLSPRGLLTLQRCAQATALIDGRRFVTPDDVQSAARPVLGVRLATDRAEVALLVEELLDETPVPRV